MSLVAARCTQCGANIEIDDTKEAGICAYCGAAFVTQKAINNYNTYITKNITKNIYGKEKTETAEYLERAETFMKLKDWEKATKAFSEAAEASPDDYRGWLGLMRSETKNLTAFNNISHIEYHRKALAVASEEEKELLNNLCGDYLKQSKAHRDRSAEFEKKRKWSLILGGISFVLGVLGSFVGLMLGILMQVWIPFVISVVVLIAGIISAKWYDKEATQINAEAVIREDNGIKEG